MQKSRILWKLRALSLLWSLSIPLMYGTCLQISYCNIVFSSSTSRSFNLFPTIILSNKTCMPKNTLIFFIFSPQFFQWPSWNIHAFAVYKSVWDDDKLEAFHVIYSSTHEQILSSLFLPNGNIRSFQDFFGPSLAYL